MTDPFVAALDALFAGPGSAAAALQPPSGPAIPIRVIASRPDQMVGFGEGRAVQGSTAFEIRRSEVPDLARGSMLALGGEVEFGEIVGGELFELLHDPLIDVEGLTWTIGAEPMR